MLHNSQYAGHISLPAVFPGILQYFTAMTQEQCQTIMDLRDPPTAEDHDNDWEMLDDILHGANEALLINLSEGAECYSLVLYVDWLTVNQG